MRILIGVILIVIFMIAGGSYWDSSKKREATEQAALKEKLKAEILTEMKESSVLNGNKNNTSKPVPEPTQQITAQQEAPAAPLEITSQNTAHQDRINVKAMLINRLHQLDANNEFIGSKARAEEQSKIIQAISDIEMTERGGSPATINVIRTQREVRDLQDQVRAQKSDMENQKRQIYWDMERQRQQLDQHKRDLENQRAQIEYLK